MDYISREDAKTLLEFAVTDKWSLEYARKRFEQDLPAADVAGEQEITLDDVLKYCKGYRLMVISEELFNTLTLMNKLSEGIK